MRALFTACVLGFAFVLTGQSKYSNPTYGISLRYPKNYEVKEGHIGNNKWGLGYLGPIPMEFVAPGGMRIVTIKAPTGSYPGTDFGTAFSTVSVNRYLSRDECRQFPMNLLSGSKTAGEREIDGIKFYSIDQGGVGLSHQWGGTYYHGFSDGLCYELGYGLATAGYGAVDGMTQVNRGDVFAILERVLKSVAIGVPQRTIRPSNFPFVRSFEVRPLQAGARSGTYRISWDVEGAEPSQVWLSAVNCLGDLSILRPNGKGAEGPAFPCGALESAGSIKGSLTLEFRNMSGDEEEETVRLFVVGHKPVSATRSIFPPPLPVIISIDTDGNSYAVDYRHPDHYAQPIADHQRLPSGQWSRSHVRISIGHSVQIGGVAFLPTDTLWIGSRSMTVTSADSSNINFEIPLSFPVGSYSMYLESEHGRSNPVRVQMVR